MGAIRKNRILKVDGRKTVVKHLAKGSRHYKTVRLGKKKKFRVAKRLVELPGVGTVLLFISKFRDETRFFVANNLEMTEKEMVALYGERFWIETFHLEIKQYLGFGEVFMRSWNGAPKHWTLVGLAYNLVTLTSAKNPTKKKKSFRQKIRHFRNSISHDWIIRSAKPNTVLQIQPRKRTT